MNTKAIPQTIDEYIASFPDDAQQALRQVRATVREAAPDAVETIKYTMPTYVLHGNLVYFAAHKNHIGFYATPAGNVAFAEELAPYKTGKGSIQFPLDKPMPLSLIDKMVRYRVQENSEKLERKKKAISQK